jgi:hypothetical protein
MSFMKTPFLKIGLRIVIFQLGLLLCKTASAAVGFTVTPSLVSNTYSGPITLQVTGLSSGASVMVQKYLDVNADGVIDAGDILWQQFDLMDGQGGMVIGGVTNINVPGDTDSVAGQITAKLNFQTDFPQTIVGKYLFKLSSTSGQFAPKTNTFTVTNFPFAQKFTGIVATNGVAISNSAVLLFQATESGDLNPAGGAVVNSSGGYTIAAPPGTYSMLAFKSNFVGDLATAANLVLSNGATIETNLTLIAATQSISGRAYDTNNSSFGLPGLLISVESTNGLLGIAMTDSNGNFAAGVNSNEWKIGPESGGLAVLGYVDSQNKMKLNTGNGSVSNVAIALSKDTALFYGTVKDNSGKPLTGEVAVYASDQNITNNYNGTYESDGYTDTNGNYVVGIVGSANTNEIWNVSVDNTSSFPSNIFSQPSFDQMGGTSVAVGVAVQANITTIPATNTITGNVKFNGNPVAGVQVFANSQDAYNYQSQGITDSNGNYSLTVGNDFWNVNLSCQGENNSLDSIIGPGNYQCPNGDSVTINNDNGTANFTVLPPGGSGQIFGYVKNPSGGAIVGVSVSANNGNATNSSTTDGSGYYSFSVGNGLWVVSVDCGGLNSLGYQCVSSENVNVSGNSVEQDFTAQSSGTSGGPLQITTTSLPDDLVSNSYNQLLSASGGQPPYSWSLSPGSLPLPTGLTLSTNGDVSGMPGTTAVGTNYFSVRVTDSLGATVDQLLSVTVYPALTIGTNAFPNGTIGVPYSAEVLVSGGDPFYLSGSPDGYTAVFTAGSPPPGLNFSYGAITSSNEYFVISGTPTNVGTFTWTGGAVDADGNQVDRNFSITITSSSLQITTSSLRNATVGADYTNQLQASGGALPYTWTIALGSQPLPSALALSTNGVISGAPAAIGTNDFIVRVTDSDAVTVTRALTLIINSMPDLGSAAKAGAQFQFLVLNAAIGQNYTVQTSTNLGSSNWTSLFITNNATTNSFPIVDPNAGGGQGFYRILVGP